jgi:hypothetical protein
VGQTNIDKQRRCGTAVKPEVSQNLAGGLEQTVCMFQDGVSPWVTTGVSSLLLCVEVCKGRIARRLETLRVSEPSEQYVGRRTRVRCCCCCCCCCCIHVPVYMLVFVAYGTL